MRPSNLKKTIIRVGNSNGIILPSDLLKMMNLEEGDSLTIYQNQKKGEIVLRMEDD